MILFEVTVFAPLQDSHQKNVSINIHSNTRLTTYNCQTVAFTTFTT